MRLNHKIILSFLGLLLMLSGLLMALSIIPSVYFKDGVTVQLVISSVATFCSGGLLYLFNRGSSRNIGKRDGYLIVTLGWVVMSLFGSLPFLLTGSISHVPDAIFESISGFTTTGASILNDIESMPEGVLLWRSTTHWIGGMGIIVLTIAILPLLGIGGMQLYSAEAPGIGGEKLHPRITQTAKRLWLIYVGMTIVETVALRLAGMSTFDAVNHAFATVSTGGFSTKNPSIAYWNDNHAVQWIIIVFMFLAGINFSLIYYFLRGSWKKMIGDAEFKFYALIVVVMTLVITGNVLAHPPAEGWDYPLRDALFQVLGTITTTGFVTADLTVHPMLITLFFMMLFLGGSAGSTSGGMKLIRHLVILKNSALEFRRLMHPNAVLPVRINQSSVSSKILFNTMAFMIVYFTIFILGSVVMSISGEDFLTSIGSSASAIGNVGPGLGKVCPTCNYAGLTSFGKLFLSLLMLVGRLEIFTVIIVLTPSFWRRT